MISEQATVRTQARKARPQPGAPDRQARSQPGIREDVKTPGQWRAHARKQGKAETVANKLVKYFTKTGQMR